ncbi:MAG: DUF4292 domain-containing protein [Bacteroidaceae bacterium]|nr:DUF4292 domain-containing protein [Bacteroidaceae bacterium]
MKLKQILFVAIAAMLVLSGCRSSRHAAKTDINTGATTQYPPTEEATPAVPDTKTDKKDKKDKTKQAERPATPTDVDALSAKLNLTLESGKKKINVGGTYRLKRNDVIQINLVYTMIISINVGTMELTPDYILILDRMNKRYCKLAYADVPSLAEAGIDFQYLQRIFWGEADESPTKALEWTYANWEALGNGQFPTQITYSAKAKSSAYKATFNLSNLKATDRWETRTEVSSKYQSVSYDAVMKAIMNVAK